MEREPEEELPETPDQAEPSPQGDKPRAATATAERERSPWRGRGGRRRVCFMCAEKMKVVDYKNAAFLRRFLSDRARIETRRRSNCCAKHQRALSSAIKRARHLALLPYTAEHIRNAGVGPAR